MPSITTSTEGGTQSSGNSRSHTFRALRRASFGADVNVRFRLGLGFEELAAALLLGFADDEDDDDDDDDEESEELD